MLSKPMGPPQAPPAPGLMDSLRFPGQAAGDYLKNGLESMRKGVADTIEGLPGVKKAKRFLGDFGRSLSDGVAESPRIGDAMRQSKELPDILRKAGGK